MEEKQSKLPAPASQLLKGHSATCKACRLAKVKCDMHLPCSRCVRLGMACVPTAPSRRGKKRKAASAAAAGGGGTDETIRHWAAGPYDGAAQIHDSVVQTVAGFRAVGVESAAASAAQSNEGIISLIRDWIAIGLRKRSSKLLAKAFNLCTSAGVPLETVLGGPAAAFLHPLFVPGDHPVVLTPGLQPSELPQPLLKGLGGIGPGTTATIRVAKAGMVCYVATPLFEETIVTAARMNQAYLENKQEASLLFLDQDSHSAMLQQVGAMNLACSTLPTDEALFVDFPKVQIRLRSGRYTTAKMRILIAHAPPTSTGAYGHSCMAMQLFARPPQAAPAATPAAVALATAAGPLGEDSPAAAAAAATGGTGNSEQNDAAPASFLLPPPEDEECEQSWSPGDDDDVDEAAEDLDLSMLPELSDDMLKEMFATG